MTGRVVHALGSIPHDLYVGRSMPSRGLFNWMLANPYKVGSDGDRQECLEKYEQYMRERIQREEAVAKTVYSLQDLTLACWCAPKDGPPLTLDDELICHGQVLLRLSEEMRSSP